MRKRTGARIGFLLLLASGVAQGLFVWWLFAK